MAAPKITTNVDEQRGKDEQPLKDGGSQKKGTDITCENSENGSGSCNNGRTSLGSEEMLWSDSETTTKTAVTLRAGSPNHSKSEQIDQCQETKSKTDKIREVVEQATSDDSKKKIDSVLTDIQQLSDLEKLLLYLRLPTGTKVEVDPLKQSFVSSLGNRYEVTQTVTWIQTHLEEDSEVSLPKQEVYDGYGEFCQRVKMKPLSTADFGKVMKQVFPTVRPRRLGTRGNSRYCYAGLRKKLSLDAPQLPDLSLTHDEVYEDSDPSDPKMAGASSHLVREWAEKLLGQKFLNLKELAVHLLEKSYVDNRSVAAFQLLSYLSSSAQGKGNQSSALPCAGSKHRETQMQLQRKLQERESIREQKKKLLEQRSHVGRSQVEKSSKSGRKSQLSKPNESLRNMLNVENGTSAECFSQPKDLSLGKLGTPKEEINGSSTPFSFESSEEKATIENAGVLDAQTVTPVHFRHSSGSSVAASPFRRKSGDRSTGSSPRPSPLDSGSTSGWATPCSEGSSKGTTRCGNSRSRASELIQTPPNTVESGKAAKVMIPRVTGSQSSKMRFPPSASIIFFPQISGVPITDYANAQKPKSKYKPIQPKPVNRRSESVNGKGTGEGGNCDCGTPKDEKNETPEGTPSVTPIPSQSAGFGSKDGPLISGTLNESSKSLVSTHAGENEAVSSSKLVTFAGRARIKTTNRRQKRSNEWKDATAIKVQAKRPCSRLPESSPTDRDAPTSLPPSKTSLCPADSPQEDMSITTLENEALMEYMNETTSADHDDELLQYFGVDACRTLPNPEESTKVPSLVNSGAQSAELSQLRKLLEQNLQCKNLTMLPDVPDGPTQSGNSKNDMVNTPSSAKDNMPTLRHLLSEHRDKMGGNVQGLLPESSRSLSGPLPASGEIAGLMYEEFRQDGNPSDASNNNNNSQVGTESFNYIDEPSREEMWNRGAFDATKIIRNSDEMLLSSDSSSGCQTSSTFLGNGNEGALQAHHDFDANTMALLSEQQQMHNQQMAIEFGPFNSASYSSVNSHIFAQHPGHSSVPPSPNTRRRAFNFLPISPRNTPVPETRSSTQSPLMFASCVGSGHTVSSVRSSIAPTGPSQPASATTSPFVSPRSTPSSHCRSRHNSGQASSAFGTPRATPHPHYIVEQPSCLNSPFISPHPTPVPFSRSRHNSSQSVPRSGLVYSTASSASNVPSRSRHPSELGMSLLSPGSAPMSPLSHPGILESDYSNVPPVMGGGGGHYSMPLVSDASHMRSRHNSSSSIPPSSPRSAPLSPMVSMGSQLIQDTYSPDQTIPFGKPMPISSPGPRRQSGTALDSLNEEPGKSGHLWSSDPLQPQAVAVAVEGTNHPSLQANNSWPTRNCFRQMDPRLVSRHRHASVGATVHQHPTLGQQVAPPPPDTLSQEVCHLMQKPPQPAQQDAQASSRSHSVPLGQMLQNAFKQLDPPQPFNDVLMSRSYPATPVGQHSFIFGADPSVDSMDVGPALSSEFGQYSGGGNDGDQLYQGDQFGCDSGRRNLSDSLDLPSDNFQDMLPTNLEDYMHDEISKFAQELEQLASSTQS